MTWKKGHSQNSGTDNPRAKLTEDQVREIRERRKPIGHRKKASDPRDSVASMAKEFGVCPKTISFIALGKLWSHLDKEDDVEELVIPF